MNIYNKEYEDSENIIAIIVIVLLVLTLSMNLVKANSSYHNVYVERVISVYDGDTFRVNITNWPAIIGNNMPVRVSGVDTPEIKGKCIYEKILAEKARDFVRNWLQNANQIELRNISRGKYFRIVADVWIDGINLTKTLINLGYGRVYNGGKKLPWC